MALPIPKVEIGFDVKGANAPFFRLDDPVKSQLDSTLYPLSGTVFYDVTDKVRSVAIRRGKNRQLDTFDAGLANIVFNNLDRTFDPEYADSPFAGQIIPRRAVRISSANQVIFTGTIDDWNLSYDVSGYSEASAACSDAFSLFANQVIAAGTATPQLPGQRISYVLDQPTVDWPDDKRAIQPGTIGLGADIIEADTNALQYLRTVAQSESGQVYIGKEGEFIFSDRNLAADDDFVVFADDGSGIGYQALQVVYGSELLYNEISLTNFQDTTATAIDTASVAEYGVLSLTQSGLLVNETGELVNLAVLLAKRYGNPEYRFESLSVILDKHSPAVQGQLLELEIGDVVQIKFTPNNIPPAIQKFNEVIRIDHEITPDAHIMSFGFSSVENSPWRLSDPVFGRLSSGNVLSF
jgi:hypothetical protein